MNAIPAQILEKYEVECDHCRTIFDALRSHRCRCLTSDPTYVCPGCHHCFCGASLDYKKRFWENAPHDLWKRKVEEDKRPFVITNPEPDSVVRPLVLVVEDEFLIQRAAIEAVQKMGYGAILAGNGIDGLAMAKKYLPEMILSDMLMPRMDGMQLCRFLKSDPDTLNIRVVMMTSLYTKARHRREFFQGIQPDEYLKKPLDFEQLERVLKKFLSP